MTEAEIHYKELQSYFKWLVTMTLAALGIIISVGLFIFYKDMSQARSDLKSQVERIKLDVKDEVQRARESANSEISKIRGDAASIARVEAQKGVDEAFKGTNIVTMVETAAKRQVGPVIERQVRNEVDRVIQSIQADIALLSQIADYAMQMRIGLRSGLTHLLQFQRTAPNEIVRMRAKSLIEIIGTDYETAIKDTLREFNFQSVLQASPIYSLDKLRNAPNLVPALLEVIESDKNLKHVAFAFLALREATGFPFQMFDIDGVNRWCDEHKRECGK
jgi:hypothetical protein